MHTDSTTPVAHGSVGLKRHLLNVPMQQTSSGILNNLKDTTPHNMSRTQHNVDHLLLNAMPVLSVFFTMVIVGKNTVRIEAGIAKTVHGTYANALQIHTSNELKLNVF